jgi:hypothetical protein
MLLMGNCRRDSHAVIRCHTPELRSSVSFPVHCHFPAVISNLKAVGQCRSAISVKNLSFEGLLS